MEWDYYLVSIFIEKKYTNVLLFIIFQHSRPIKIFIELYFLKDYLYMNSVDMLRVNYV